jgi:ornithine carbamoyltransferase
VTARHFLELTDLDAAELDRVLALCRQAPGELGRPLSGQDGPGGVALLFEKPSNRTRHSMEMAVAQLGGHPVYTRGEEVGLDVREPVEDVTRVLAGYHRIIAARVFDHAVLERMAAVSDVPIVNMLSDVAHPLQALADLLAMEAALGSLTGRTVAYVGDFNNVARSLGEGCALRGAHVRFGCPEGFGPSDAELERFMALGAPTATVSVSPFEAVEGAHAVHTDTWVSMGQEDEKLARVEKFAGFTVDADLMARADEEAIFLHCLPAYRGYEVTAEVIDGPRSRVVEQAHQRLHAARGLLAFVLTASDDAGGSR